MYISYIYNIYNIYLLYIYFFIDKLISIDSRTGVFEIKVCRYLKIVWGIRWSERRNQEIIDRLIKKRIGV